MRASDVLQLHTQKPHREQRRMWRERNGWKGGGVALHAGSSIERKTQTWEVVFFGFPEMQQPRLRDQAHLLSHRRNCLTSQQAHPY